MIIYKYKSLFYALFKAILLLAVLSTHLTYKELCIQSATRSNKIKKILFQVHSQQKWQTNVDL